MPYQHNKGFIFGTVYNITYQSDKNLEKEIIRELDKVDASLRHSMKNLSSLRLTEMRKPLLTITFTMSSTWQCRFPKIQTELLTLRLHPS